MKRHYYSENKTPIRRRYELFGKSLTISGKQGLGQFRTEIDLADVATHSTRLTFFHQQALKRMSTYLAVILVIAYFARSQFPSSQWVIFLVAAFAALPGIVVLLRFSRPMEAEQFKSHSGVLLFDIIFEKSQAEEFDCFVRVIRDAVREAQTTKSPNKAPEPTPVSVTPRATDG